MACQIHVGDIGTQLIVTVKDDGEIVDLSTASILQIILKKPDLTTVTKIASLYTDGTDGKMYYVSVDGDFNMTGTYKIQGKVTFVGALYYTSTDSFKVYGNL